MKINASDSSAPANKRTKLFEPFLTEDQVAAAKDPTGTPTLEQHKVLDFLLLDSEQHLAIAKEKGVEHYQELVRQYGSGSTALSSQVSCMALASLRASLIVQLFAPATDSDAIN